MENRISKLELDQCKADKNLSKTLHTIQIAEQVRARKQLDLDLKNQWLEEKHEALMN